MPLTSKMNWMTPHPGARLESAGADVEPDDKAHEDCPENRRLAGDVMKQGSGRSELQRRIEGRVEKGGDHHQKAYDLAVVVVGVHVPGSDETVPFAHQPGPFAEEGSGDGNGQDVKGGKRVGQAREVDGTRMGYEGPAAEGCRGGGQQEGEKRYRAAGDGVAGRGLLGEIPFQPPIETVNDVNPQHDVYPGCSARGRIDILYGSPGPG